MEVRERTGRAGNGQPRKRMPAEDDSIVYTQPKPFNQSRFFLRMVTVVAIVLALVLGMSIFFKVKTVNVSGTEKYTPWQIREASGIQDGENLLTLNKGQIVGRIRARLPYVDEMQIGISLPDVVNIHVTELAVTYAVADGSGSWWLMDADGRVVDKTATPGTYTRILGVELEGPQIGQQAKALEPEVEAPSGTAPDGQQEIAPPVVHYAKEKLAVVIGILQELEKNGILGVVASVDVSDLEEVELWYADRYRVRLGEGQERLAYKLEAMARAIEQMGSYQAGELDVSFTVWPDQVGFTPFE